MCDSFSFLFKIRTLETTYSQDFILPSSKLNVLYTVGTSSAFKLDFLWYFLQYHIYLIFQCCSDY